MTIAPFTGPAEQTRYFDFHGTGIAIMADRPDVREAMHIRFRHFAVDALPGAPELTFIFQDEAEGHPPHRQTGGQRQARLRISAV